MSATIRRPRATVHVYGDFTAKYFFERERFERELWVYENEPWCCPRLLRVDYREQALFLETLPVAYDRGRPLGSKHLMADRLYELLVRLHGAGIHHRDVHPKNIVLKDGFFPLLIDWETALLPEDGPGGLLPSYDLYGPEVSSIAPPSVHRAIRSRMSPDGYCMWWGANHPMSIKNQWGVDVPSSVEGR